MHFRQFLKPVSLAATCAAFLLATCLTAVSAEAPADNVVVILVDDLGWRDLACMGSPVYETPHIDALAQSGTLFTNAYAPSSICSPSRACLLTGSQPSRHGVYTVVKNRGKESQWKVIPKKNRQFLAKDYPTIGTLLTDAGIANGAIGKWHVAGSSPSNGFDEGELGGYLGLPINYFAPFKLGFLPQDVAEGTYLPTFIRKAGTDFLERHQDERFFLYFSTYLPHDEINNADEDPDAEGMFRLAAPLPVVEKYRKKIAAMQKAGSDLQGHDNPVYAAMIEETDRSVGAIIDKLDELQLREKTLVLFISDNGGLSKYTSNRPLRGEKTTLYEGGIRVPVIVSMPGKVAAGKTLDEPVSGIDFYPTLCTYFGVQATDPTKVDGEDLTELLFAGKSLGERNLFWNFPAYNWPEDPARCPRSALRRGDWKIIHRYEDNGYELYNLKTDIGESTDLSESHSEILQKMRQQLEASYQRFGAAPSLSPNPAYRSD
jgi:arylsulfatase A-like enzyme